MKKEITTTKIAIFKGKKVRKTIHDNEWWFSVIDIIEVLTGTERPRKYWNDLKKKLINEGYSELSEKIGQLKLEASDGKMRETDCANTETIFRIIQTIPSPKVEPFKRWLAKVGYERVQEIENPELATKRTRTLYKLKGYSDDWIEKRMRGIAIREELTDEWKERGAREQKDYEILTAEISKATFGVTPSQYKKIKSLKRENALPFAKNEITVFYYRSDLISDEHKEKIVDFRNYDNSGKWYILLDEAHLFRSPQASKCR